LRFASTIVVVCLSFAGAAHADPKPSYDAFGFFAEGGATVGLVGGFPTGAGSVGIGATLRWLELGFTGYYGSTFDGSYSGGAFLGRVAARIPTRYVAVTFGSEIGYLDVPHHYIEGLLVEPFSIGLELEPVCHFRMGLLGAVGFGTFDAWDNSVLRVALTVGYVTGACSKR
jgi:hypothetical protein